MGASVPDSAWVKRVTHYYNSFGLTIIEHDLAVGGRNCYQGMPSSYTPPAGRDYPQAGNVTEALSPANNPDVVIVSYPTNNYNFYSISEIMFCLQTMKDSVNALGRTCYVTSSQPRQDGSFPDFASRRILKVIRDSIMNRFGTYAIDFFTDVATPDSFKIRPEYSYGDNIHLNDAGHRVLFQKVLAKNIFDLALPIHLNDFSARQVLSGIEIDWMVTDEAAGSGYVLQRSNDAMQFENIFTTSAPSFSSNNKYKYLDAKIADGNYYYRLLMIENGKRSYSTIKKVSILSSVTIEKISSSSSTLQLYISSAKNEHIRIELLDMKGQKMYRVERNVHPGLTSWNIPIQNYSTGIYAVLIQSNSSRQIRQIFKKE